MSVEKLWTRIILYFILNEDSLWGGVRTDPTQNQSIQFHLPT